MINKQDLVDLKEHIENKFGDLEESNLLQWDNLHKETQIIKRQLRELKEEAATKKDLEKSAKSIKRSLKMHIRLSQNAIIDHFDKRDLHARNRLDRIENHLQLPVLKFEE